MRLHYKRSDTRIFTMNHSEVRPGAQSAHISPSAGYVALIPAAGVGARMGGQLPKQYLQLGEKSVLQHTVEAFLAAPDIAQVFVVVSADDAYVDDLLLRKIVNRRLQILRCGGATRSESVLNGLKQMRTQIDPDDWVLVHDAARPGITPALIQNLINRVGDHAVGGLLALPVVDTVKRVTVNAKVETIARTGLWLAQTPQMFRYQLLCDALQRAENRGGEITDEASAIEAMGLSPCLVEGHPRNNKLTRPDDAALIQFYL
jgi:2-C-methyl-D-erythritol 4-phosphate cytidylyltransferase